MFPKTNRLQLRQEKDFFQTSKRKSFPCFQVFWKNSDQIMPLFAVVVPKKVSLKATVRHKLLRQVRQILTQRTEKFQNKKVVIVLFYSSLNKTYQELASELERVSL